MQIQEMKLTAIKPYENNPRKNDPAVEAVAASIKEFGWQQPIVVDRDMVIIAGHTRYKAAKKLKLKVVPVLVAEGLSDEQVKAYRLADNKSGELAEWDEAALLEELAQIGDIDMAAFGFDALDSAFEEEGKTDEDAIPEIEENEPPVSIAGEIYQLGRHRLMCGDSTSADDVARLMAGELADMAFTSPPYGAGDSAKIRTHYVKGEKTLESFYNEHKDDKHSWQCLFEKSLANMINHTRVQFVNVQMLADNKRQLLNVVNQFADNLVDIVIWDKRRAAPQMQRNVLNNRFEFIFIFDSESNSRSIRFGDFHGTEQNVIEITVEQNKYAKIHRAVFPTALPSAIIRLNKKAKSVLDLFGGTGTSIISCEQLGRDCYMMELDPKYCDVIRRRWAEYTHGEGCDWAALTPAL